MQKRFTEEDILRYIYGETEGAEHLAITTALEYDLGLQGYYKELLKLTAALDSVKDEPDSTIIKILNEESRSSSLEIH